MRPGVRDATVAGTILCLCLAPALLDRTHRGHILLRQMTRVAEAAAVEKGHTLVIGDSIAEASAPATLCGDTVFNAAIGGTGVRDWLAEGRRLTRIVDPRRVVVSLGVNDANVRFGATDQWNERFDALVRTVGSGREVIVVAPLPVQPFGKGPSFSETRMADMRQHLAALSGLSVAVVPPRRTDGLTVADGVHPNAAGRRAWAQALERSACAGKSAR
jgi:lysophospholipase L1-like esterase